MDTEVQLASIIHQINDSSKFIQSDGKLDFSTIRRDLQSAPSGPKVKIVLPEEAEPEAEKEDDEEKAVVEFKDTPTPAKVSQEPGACAEPQAANAEAGANQVNCVQCAMYPSDLKTISFIQLDETRFLRSC